MAAIVRDRRVANQMFAPRPDRRNPIIGAQARSQRSFRLPARRAAMFRRRFETHPGLIDNQHRELSRPSDNHDRIAPAALTRDRETTAGKRVVDAPGQRALAHDCEFRRSSQWASDQRTEGKSDGSFGRERIGIRSTFGEKQPYTQAAAADRRRRGVPDRSGVSYQRAQARPAGNPDRRRPRVDR